MTLSLKTVLPGILSKQDIELEFTEADQEDGIFFELPGGIKLAAHHQNLYAANRNTVLGNDQAQVCFVEHLLAAINLLSLHRINIKVSGAEIPLEDGSAKIWLQILKNWPLKKTIKPSYSLQKVLSVQDGSKALLAYPAETFKMTYLFRSPVDGSQSWTSWQLTDGLECLAFARTFAAENEHKLLGLQGKMLSYNQNGFDLPLHSPQEPALHKLLDLFGDLSLSGLNPLTIKAHFISILGGHHLNLQMSKQLSKQTV